MKNSKQVQSLLNEHKGYLFEFLVAKLLAEKSSEGVDHFLHSIDPSLWQRLQDYQRSLIQDDKLLYQQLPVLAAETANYYYHKMAKKSLQSVHLTSRKHSKAKHHADITLQYAQSATLLSLKLCRHQAYVNTKSAGIKSFFEKYFTADDGEQKIWQKDCDQKISLAFHQLRISLLEKSGLDFYSNDFAAWKEEQLGTRPGELASEYRELLLNYYHECISSIFTIFEQRWNNPDKRQLLINDLVKLCGLDQGVEHLFCFHQGTQSYALEKITQLSLSDLVGVETQLIPPRAGSSYFLINYYKVLTLQIRVKPMRDFTTEAMKINCAVKLHD